MLQNSTPGGGGGGGGGGELGGVVLAPTVNRQFVTLALRIKDNPMYCIGLCSFLLLEETC